MDDPELRSDEKLLVRTPGVYVKSIPFEGLLTNRRVILIDREKNLLPPKEIPLVTIQESKTGENTVRDPTLVLSIMVKSGGTRQMILTFPPQDGQSRAKERDAWASILRKTASSSFEQIIRKVIPVSGRVPGKAEPGAQPRIAVVNTPLVQNAPVRAETTERKEGGSIHPIKKIIESAPPAPYPEVPDTSAEGSWVFCSRCGNKVPGDSRFCNRCGSRIVLPESTAPVPSAPPGSPADPLESTDPESGKEKPVYASRAEPAPPYPLDDNLQETPAPATIPAKTDPSFLQTPAGPGRFFRHFLPKDRSPDQPTSPTRSRGRDTPLRRKSGGILNHRYGKVALWGIAAVLVIVLVIVMGGMFLSTLVPAGGSDAAPGSPTRSVTPLTTAKATGTQPVVVERTPVPVPATGVYVHVSYIGGWKGSYGVPGEAESVINSGDRFYEVRNATGTVSAAFEKLDGSTRHALAVEIYRDGRVLTKGETAAGYGKVTVSVNIVSGVAQAPQTS